MATEPRGQRASACVGGRVRLALMCVDSWNSVGPLLAVSAQSGMKTETECGGRCCLVRCHGRCQAHAQSERVPWI